MLAPPPLPRTLEASLRDLSSQKAPSRASAIVDLVRYARADPKTRAEALPRIERALHDAAPTVRAAAAVALGDLEAAEALPALLVCIEDSDPYVRQMAMNALGEIGDARAAPRLLRALCDERPEVRYQAIIAFPRVAKDDAEAIVFALDRALGDADESVRYIALRIAEERADAGVLGAESRVVAHAKRLVTDPAAYLALAAAIFLAKVGEKEGRDVILRAIDQPTLRPRGPAREDENEAILVAGAVGMRDAVPALERRAWGLGRFVADTCAFSARIALARMGHARAIAEIGRDLGSRKRQTRDAAVVAAGRARLKSLSAVIADLGPDDADPDLVARALATLGEAGSST
jgi:HEAT repeat protein